MVNVVSDTVVAQGTDISALGGTLYTSPTSALLASSAIQNVPGWSLIFSATSPQTFTYDYNGTPTTYTYNQINQVLKKTAGGVDVFLQISNDVKVCFTNGATIDEVVASVILRMGHTHSAGTVTGTVEHKLPVDAQVIARNAETLLYEPFYGLANEAYAGFGVGLYVEVFYVDKGFCLSFSWARDGDIVMRNGLVLSEFSTVAPNFPFALVWTPSLTNAGYDYNANLARSGQSVTTGGYKGFVSNTETNFQGYSNVLQFADNLTQTYAPNFLITSGSCYGAFVSMRYLINQAYTGTSNLIPFYPDQGVRLSFGLIGYPTATLPIVFTGNMAAVFRTAVAGVYLV